MQVVPEVERDAFAKDKQGTLAPPIVLSEAFETIYQSNFAFVWRSLRRLGVQPANLDDASQDVFIVIHRQLATFEGRSSLKAWIFAIVRRVAHDYRRSFARKDAKLDRPSDNESRTWGEDPRAARPDRSLEDAEATQLVHRVLDGLDDDKREVFVLIELEDMSVPDVAQLLGANVNTVYSRIRAAREAFNRLVEKHVAEPRQRRLP